MTMRHGEDGAGGTRLAVQADHARIVGTIVAAFDRDPAFRAFFGPGPEFAELATAYAMVQTERRASVGSVWLTADGDATALWTPPADTVALPASTFDPPAEAAARLHEYDTAVDAFLPVEPHWYLGILASHPSRRGQGLGRRVAEPGLAAARAAGVPAVLETTNPDNVPMYQRSGWRVTAELDVIGLHVWVMQVDPV